MAILQKVQSTGIALNGYHDVLSLGTIFKSVKHHEVAVFTFLKEQWFGKKREASFGQQNNNYRTTKFTRLVMKTVKT